MHLILVPGLWLDGSSWDDVAPALLAAGHTVHAMTLPGMSSTSDDRASISLADHVDAVVQAIDAIGPSEGPVVLIGHSGGGAIAYAACDARVDRVARVIYVDSLPLGDGGVINDSLPQEGGEIPFPDWSAFDPEDLIDLDEDLRRMLRARAIPAPLHVARDPQRLFNDLRYEVPASVIACEFTGDMARTWIANGEPYLAELARIRQVDYIDLPTGHWPQFTRPRDLGDTILAIIGPA